MSVVVRVEDRHGRLVRRRTEVPVELADGTEVVRLPHGEVPVGGRTESIDPTRRCDRHGERHLDRPAGPGDLARRSCGRTGGDTVVDDHHVLPPEGTSGPRPTEAIDPSDERDSLTFDDGPEFVARDVRTTDQLVVQDDDSAFPDGTHGQFLLERHAEFPHDDHVERGIEGCCDLGGHRNTTSRQADDDDVLPSVANLRQRDGQQVCELSAGVDAILERGGGRRGPRGRRVEHHGSIAALMGASRPVPFLPVYAPGRGGGVAEHDLVIRNGTVVDGTGAPRRIADVAVSAGRITRVEPGLEGRGRREIDADGLLVTPGFVDIHTHYDGQATWDSALAPSSWHGVTTAVMGNCGVGFAPVHVHDRERLIQLMEGVEDIPGTALHEGLAWDWASFPQYLDALDRRPRDIDLGAQVPHGALRLHVMGERGATQQPATPDDIADMARLAGEAIEAGALGFSTSRTLNHRTSLGEPTPTLQAEADELIGIARALGAAGTGVLQVVSDFIDLEGEIDLFRRMASESGRPISVSIAQGPRTPDDWRTELDAFAAATAAGVTMRGQVAARAVGLVLGLEATLHPFLFSPAYVDIAGLPLGERVAHLRHPDVRRAVIDGARVEDRLLGSRAIHRFGFMFRLGDPPNYEPDPSESVAAEATRRGCDPIEVAYDWLLERDGTALLYQPVLNWAAQNLDAVGDMLRHPASVPGLSDGGAHVGTICDVSFPTTLLQWWGRDRPTGRRPVETLVATPCRLTAETVGLGDRGVVLPGFRADLNVIDFDGLRLHAPEIAHDLPAGGRRMLQRATGYRHTFVAGTEVMADGESTGATPGRLVRGAR
ncbi:MAG: hypothetical protein RLZZ01_1194 [Actinomycetota bacterium]